MASGNVVIAAYRPEPGREGELDALVAEHVPILRAEGLVSDRKPFVMRAEDGTVVEVFEWASAEAASSAHENSTVQATWARFAKICDYVSLADLPESREMFATFTTIDFESPNN